ncbi:MAG TPA: DUF2695 domain-containing protein [Candidatus Limnocylindrales bacterium]|nr:DUF2695 domain-containing protein [Candidatus Limnocylindrales bacterium]
MSGKESRIGLHPAMSAPTPERDDSVATRSGGLPPEPDVPTAARRRRPTRSRPMRRNGRTPTLAREELRALVDHLDRNLPLEACDQTLRISKTFLAGRGLNVGRAVRWLETQGAYCDCEVLMNLW